jgi:hypothetical protein
MRHLIDTYIEADESRKISPFDNMSLLELIVKSGIANAINAQLGGIKSNKDAVAETIENNVRSKIIKEHLTDPDFYEKMSALLDEIIAARKAKAIEYEAYLAQFVGDGGVGAHQSNGRLVERGPLRFPFFQIGGDLSVAAEIMDVLQVALGRFDPFA